MIEKGHSESPGSVKALLETTVPAGNTPAGKYGLFCELITGIQITGLLRVITLYEGLQ